LRNDAFEQQLKLVSVQLEDVLKALLPPPNTRLHEAMAYGVLGGGKRLRAFLTYAAADLFSVPSKTALDVAAAIEFVHAYSLVHDDLPAMEGAIDGKTAAILVEPIQGEGGVVVPDPGYLQGLRELCDRRGLLLIFDEVQVGMGRTGKLFAYEHFGVEPDVMTLAKALGGGLPLGAMLAKEAVARSFSPSSHASTFGGNPLVCGVGLAVIRTLLQDGVLKNCVKMGKLLFSGLQRLKKRFPFVRDVRGRGLILGMELEHDGSEIVQDCLTEGLLINCTMDRVLRFMPPLIVSEEEIDLLIEALDRTFAKR